MSETLSRISETPYQCVMMLVNLAVEQRVVFKIIHMNLAYVGHRMNLYFDESTAEKDTFTRTKSRICSVRVSEAMTG